MQTNADHWRVCRTHHVLPRVKVGSVEARESGVEPPHELLLVSIVVLSSQPIIPAGNYCHVIEDNVPDNAEALLIAGSAQVGELLPGTEALDLAVVQGLGGEDTAGSPTDSWVEPVKWIIRPPPTQA